MLDLVDARDLVVLGDPHPDRPVDREGEERGDDERVREDRDDADDLLAELFHAAAVEEARGVGLDASGGEEADEDRADDAADEVDADDVEGVVVAELVLEADRHGAQDTGDDADREGAQGADGAARRGDGDEAGDRAGRGAEGGEGAVAQLLVDEPAEDGRCGGDLGVEEHDRADAVVVAEPGSGVEAEPAEPEEGRAEHDEREAVRPHRVLLEADALADDQDDAEGGGAGVDVDGGAAGEVDDAHLEEPAAGAPDPVGDGEVDDGDPQDDEERPGGELHAVGEGAADQGRGEDREHELEGGEDVHRDGVAVPEFGDADPAEADVVAAPADDRADVGAEGEAESVEHPQDRDDPEADEAHHQHVEGALDADHASVEEGQAGGHEHHQGRADEHEPGVGGRQLGGVCGKRRDAWGHRRLLVVGAAAACGGRLRDHWAAVRAVMSHEIGSEPFHGMPHGVSRA